MRRLEDLIDQVRRQTDNTNYSDTEGIPQEELVQFFNEAQETAQAKVLKAVPESKMFDTITTFTPVANQRNYSLTPATWLGNTIRSLEYKPSTDDQDYYHLTRRTLWELSPLITSYPDSYDLQNGEILISPVPSSTVGTFRATYTKKLYGLDIRRAKISSTTNNGTNYTTIVLDSAATIDAILTDTDNFPYYICVVNSYGVMQYPNIEVTAYDTATTTMTVAAALTGGTIPNGTYIVYGQNKTTHSQLRDEFEKFLIAYAANEIFKRDSSPDGPAQSAKMNDILDDLIGNEAGVSRDLSAPVVTNDFYLL